MVRFLSAGIHTCKVEPCGFKGVLLCLGKHCSSSWGGMSFMDLKVEFVRSAWERKDHPFISLWAGDATMWDHLMQSEKVSPWEGAPQRAPSYTFLKCLFLAVPGCSVMQQAPPSLSHQLRAEVELPVRAEQLWNRTAPRRPCWLQEWICLTDELSCQRWACHAWLKMISVTPVHRPWPLSDLFSNGNGFVWTLRNGPLVPCETRSGIWEKVEWVGGP